MINLLKLSILLLAFVAISINQAQAQSNANAINTSENKKPTDLSEYYTKKTLNPGVFLEERELLYANIMKAEKNGVGVKAYLNAFNYVETMVKSGAKQEDIARRIDSISKGLDEQFKRSRILKIQKLPPPIAASSPPPSAMYQSSPRSSSLDMNNLNGNKAEILNKIKDNWFGGDVPDSIKNRIPQGFDPNKLSKSDLDKLMNRLGK